MTEAYISNNFWFPCKSCGKPITHSAMHSCYPNLLNPTDEQIIEISKTYDLNNVLDLIDFARAIIKKASEK
jgi:hypothetical protein